jgi:hypothetical protein
MQDECVICGGDLPAEGYGEICESCKKVAEELSPVEAAKKRVSFSYGYNPCVSIKNSYMVTSNEDIKAVLEYIRGLDGYKKLKEYGYSRTPQSEFNEWKGHNELYRLGYKRSRTGSVDIDEDEPMWRRFIYAILSIF